MSLYLLTYSSIAVQPFSRSDLQALLRQARSFNQTAGVTGLLLYRDSRFVQVLEGAQHTVLDLYRRIENDPRHAKLRVLSVEGAASRAFSAWSMGYIPVEQSASGNFIYSNKPDDLQSPGTWAAPAAFKLLAEFQSACVAN